MDDELESLIVEVRASTGGFAQDIAAMRGVVDSTLTDGFSAAGNALERGLLGAIRRGSLGFDDLKRVALNTLNEIAAHSVRNLFAGLSGGTGLGGALNLGGLVSAALGLPGRATGGPVSPGRGYLVGERGPGVFLPTSAGRIETLDGGHAGRRPRDVRVAINVTSPPGGTAPQALQRSARQVASAVRRAIAQG